MAMMTERELANIAENEEQVSVNYYTSEISQDQETALDYYHGRPFGDEVEGRSSVVSQDIAEIVDTQVSDLLEMIASDPKSIKLIPVGVEDKAFARQCQAYCNYVFWQSNNGFSILHDALFDASLQKLGIAKVYWDDRQRQTEEVYEGLSLINIMDMEQDEEYEIVEATAYDADDPETMDIYPDGNVYDVRVRRTQKRGFTAIINIPPEDFLINVRAQDINNENYRPRYIGHRNPEVTKSDLLEMDFDPKIVENLPAAQDTGTIDGRREHRFRDEDYNGTLTDSMDDAMQRYTLLEEYLEVDFDNDGIAEYRQIYRVGHTILSNEVVDDHPFASCCLYRMPHKLYGQSVFDKARDMQRIKSVLWRGMLDAQYLANNPRLAVDTAGGKVNLDDLLSSRAGGVVRTQGNPAQLIMPLAIANQSGDSLSLLQVADQEKMRRTGVSQTDPALDGKAFMHDTASGQEKIMSKQGGRQRTIGRLAGEFVKRIYKLMIKTMVQYQSSASLVKVQKEWVYINPQDWDMDFDVIVDVGQGQETKDKAIALQMAYIEKMEALMGKVTFVTEEHLQGAYARLTTLMGMDPDEAIGQVVPPEQRPEPQPDPMLVLTERQVAAQEADIQGKQQAKAKELQLKEQKQAVDQKVKVGDFMLDAEKTKAELQIRELELASDQYNVDTSNFVGGN